MQKTCEDDLRKQAASFEKTEKACVDKCTDKCIGNVQKIVYEEFDAKYHECLGICYKKKFSSKTEEDACIVDCNPELNYSKFTDRICVTEK